MSRPLAHPRSDEPRRHEESGPRDDDASDRPTLVPEFAPEDFARDSEIKQRVKVADGGEATIDRARRHRLAGENEEALFLLTRLLELAPLHPEGSRLAADCRQALERECLAAIGSESATLAVGVTPDELRRFSLDNVSGFLLSVMDGATDIETILDISGLPRLLALRHVRNLLDRGIVGHVSQLARAAQWSPAV